MKHLLLFLSILIFSSTASHAQSEIEGITATLTDYIEGSTGGQPDRLKQAFYEDLNLYATNKEGEMTIWSGKDYILDTKEGKPTGEDGWILSIDYENDAAVAKVKISHPQSKSSYIDYFMLLKVKGQWKIIHKMYTREVSNKQE